MLTKKNMKTSEMVIDDCASTGFVLHWLVPGDSKLNTDQECPTDATRADDKLVGTVSFQAINQE